MAILSSKSKRIIEVALANRVAKNELVAAIGSHAVVMCAVATNVSTTVDFGALKAGDFLVRIKAGTTGGALFDVCIADGTAPAAAVVGDLYVGIRLV
jgi:hypothetical protein